MRCIMFAANSFQNLIISLQFKQFKCKMISQLNKRHIKRPIQAQNTTSTFLKLKAEAVELLNQLDLYRQNNVSNYYILIAQIIQQMALCDSYEQGEICLLLCKTAVNLNFSFDSLRLSNNYADLVIQYINHLMQPWDTSRLKQQTTRDVYQGRFKFIAEDRKSGDQQQKLRDLLLIQRIDVVLARITQAEQLNTKLSRLVLEFILSTLTLAEKYLGIPYYFDFITNVEKIVQGHTKVNKILIRNNSLPLRPNYVIIDQKTADFHEPEVKMSRTDHIKPRSIHRTSSRLQAKVNSLHDPIQSQNLAMEDKKTINSSLRLKGSLKRRSGSKNATKRGSIQDKKLTQNVVRKSVHYTNKYANQGKVVVQGPRISRFNQLSKNEINGQKEEFSSPRSQFKVNQVEPTLRKRQNSHFNNATNEVAESMRPFYIFLQEKHRICLLVFEHNRHQNSTQQSGKVQSYLLFDGYSVVSQEILNIQLKEDQFQEQAYLSQLVQLLLVYRNNRNQLTLEIKQKYSTAQNIGNIVRVNESQRGLLMGFVRKISTYFIVQCVFDLSQLKNCNQNGIKRRLLNENQVISFPVSFSYKLMNQDLYMTFQQIQNFVKSKGSVIVSLEKQDNNNQQAQQFGQKNYKVAITNFTVKQLSQVKFSYVWWKNSFDLVFQLARSKRKEKNSGTEIIQKQKTGTSFDSKRIKRIAKNKSSIKINQSQLQKIFENNEFTKINSNYKTASRREVSTCEQLSYRDRIIKAENKKKAQMKRGKQLITSIRTEKGYKLVRRWILQQPQTVKYNQYYGYLQRRASLIEYYKGKSSFSEQNQNNYLKSCLTIHGKRNKIEAKNTKLLTFLKRLKTQSALLGYLVGSIKLLIKDRNKYVFLEVYWQSMQKYFIFILSQDMFQKMTKIELDNLEKHSFSTSAEKQAKKRDKRTSVVSSLMRNRQKDNMKKSNQSQKKNIKVPKVMSIQRQNQSAFKTQTNHKLKSRTNTIFRVDKTSESFSFSTFNNMKFSERLHFKREVASYIKNKFIKHTQFVWKQHSLVLEIYNPNKSGEKMYEIEGKELAVKNIHLGKNTQKYKDNYSEWQVIATELLVIRYKQSNLANLKFYTSECLNKIYFQHLFMKNNDDLFGSYKSKLCLKELNENRSRIVQFYSKENCFFENAGKEQEKSLPLYQPRLKNFFSKHSKREEEKRYKYAEIINLAKKCSLSFEFIQKKRNNMLKDVFVIPNRYPHLQLQQFMFSVQITFEDIFIKDLNGQVLLAFSKQKLLNYFPYIFRVTKTHLKSMLVNRLLKDEDLIRLCQERRTTYL